MTVLYITRKDHEIELTQKGVTGAALEALLAETAYERHQSRVAYAQWAAVEFYLTVAGVRREEVSQDTLALFAEAILWADVIGIGGRFNVEGTGTARHPAFAKCGKGRKLATDGGAWTAAIREAAVQFDSGEVFYPKTLEDGQVVLAFGDVVIYEIVIPGPWMLSICREGLRRAACLRWPATSGMFGWHDCFPISAPPESLTGWASLVNEVTHIINGELAQD